MIPARRMRQWNPLQFLMTNAIEGVGPVVDDFELIKLLSKKYDWALFHWPEGFATEPKSLVGALVRSVSLLMALSVLKLRGTALFWMAHDIEPLRRRRPYLARFLMNKFVSQMDGVFFLSHTTLDSAVERWPHMTTNRFIVALGLLGEQYGETPPSWAGELREFARSRKVAGYLGDIKPYKNPNLLAELAENLPSDWVVLVAGRAENDPDIQAAIAELRRADISDRVFLVLERIADDNMRWVMKQCVAVLLPYAWGWNTGLGHLALECGVSVIGSTMPALAGLSEQYPSAPIRPCKDSSEYLQALRYIPIDVKGQWQVDFLERNSWPKVATMIVDAMRTISRAPS